MDDISSLIATKKHNTAAAAKIAHHIQHLTYDQQHKHLFLKPQPDNQFLDTRITIYNNNTNVKIIYLNKNTDCTHSNLQTIGRFHHFTCPSSTSHKLSAALNIFIRTYDFTTYPHDMLTPSIALIYELLLLDYPLSFIRGAIARAARSRRNPIWTSILTLSYFIYAHFH